MLHISVLKKETIDSLNIKSDGKYVDCTLGFGGHSEEILKKLGQKGFLFAFDQDPIAIAYSEKRLEKVGVNFKICDSNFKNIKSYIDEEVDGIIYDLGVSSPQLDEDVRGFSFHKDAHLDMRMNTREGKTAYDVVNNYEMYKLMDIFYNYGEEKYAKQIAKGIINSRPINTTLELVEVIKNNVPASYRNEKHPARKIFQAIRIEVNDELAIFEQSLLDSFSLLKSGGILSVITFHSLEDRIVKNVFKRLCEDDIMSRKMPVVPEDMKKKAIHVTRKPIVASDEELEDNRRSRSAKLRVIKKI